MIRVIQCIHRLIWFCVCFSFSTTEGADWYTHNFTEDPMNVYGVVNEPGLVTMVSRYMKNSNTNA